MQIPTSDKELILPAWCESGHKGVECYCHYSVIEVLTSDMCAVSGCTPGGHQQSFTVGQLITGWLLGNPRGAGCRVPGPEWPRHLLQSLASPQTRTPHARHWAAPMGYAATTGNRDGAGILVLNAALPL